MTHHRPGARQRAILAAMRDGTHELCKNGAWFLRHSGHGQRTPVDARAAGALRDHGYIMYDRPLAFDGDRFVLTLKGKGTAS